MGFLQTLVRLFDGCVGLLEVLTLLFDIAAIYLGMTTFQKHKHVAAKLAHHYKVPLKKPSWWPFVVVLMLAVGFTFLTLWKWLYLAD